MRCNFDESDRETTGGADTDAKMEAFGTNALVAGVYFAIFMGAMTFFGWSNNSLGGALVGSAVSGILFGLSMASYFRFVRRKHNLPLWRDFKPAE